jgi:hypothetical protein
VLQTGRELFDAIDANRAQLGAWCKHCGNYVDDHALRGHNALRGAAWP